MIPECLVDYHNSLIAMRSEFDALALDLASICTSASRLADAANRAARAMPSDAQCPQIVEGLDEIAAGMRDFVGQFTVIHAAIAAHAAVVARSVGNFELDLLKEK